MPTCQLILGRGSAQIYSRVSLLYSIYKSDAALLIDCVARRRVLLQLRFLQQLLAQTHTLSGRQTESRTVAKCRCKHRVNCQLCRTCNSSCFCCCCCYFRLCAGLSARHVCARFWLSSAICVCLFVSLPLRVVTLPNTLTPHSHSATLSPTTIKYR